ncbi:MAG: hypothetical protein R2708_24445 [Vicinamibacterales bacterium]
MPSGHVRWLLEQFEFDFEVVYPQTLDAGNLNAKYDVLLFPDGGIPENSGGGGGFFGRQPKPEEIPAEYRGHLGSVTIEKTVPQLKRFAEAGGVIVAFGGSAVLGHHLGLPVSDHMVEVTPAGVERTLCRATNATRAGIDPARRGGQHLRRWRSASGATSMCSSKTARCWHWRRTPRWRACARWRGSAMTPRCAPDGPGASITSKGGTAAVEAAVGKGKVFLFGPEITFRAQPHGTFKFLFNGIYYGTAE